MYILDTNIEGTHSHAKQLITNPSSRVRHSAQSLATLNIYKYIYICICICICICIPGGPVRAWPMRAQGSPQGPREAHKGTAHKGPARKVPGAHKGLGAAQVTGPQRPGPQGPKGAPQGPGPRGPGPQGQELMPIPPPPLDSKQDPLTS